MDVLNQLSENVWLEFFNDLKGPIVYFYEGNLSDQMYKWRVGGICQKEMLVHKPF